MSARRLLALWVVLLAAAGTRCASVAQSEPAARVAPASVEGGEWFARSGCASCHAVSVYGIQPLAATGPDLSIAVEDVPKRFGRTLEEFLHAPTGTMQMVLSSRILMTNEDRAVAIDKLREAYRRHQDAASRPVASH